MNSFPSSWSQCQDSSQLTNGALFPPQLNRGERREKSREVEIGEGSSYAAEASYAESKSWHGRRGAEEVGARPRLYLDKVFWIKTLSFVCQQHQQGGSNPALFKSTTSLVLTLVQVIIVCGIVGALSRIWSLQAQVGGGSGWVGLGPGHLPNTLRHCLMRR